MRVIDRVPQDQRNVILAVMLEAQRRELLSAMASRGTSRRPYTAGRLYSCSRVQLVIELSVHRSCTPAQLPFRALLEDDSMNESAG